MGKKFQILLPLGLFAFLVGLVLFIALRYVASERYFYFWDYAMYQRMAIDQTETSFESNLKPIKNALKSIGKDYNSLFTLPLIPLMRLIGPYQSRSTYIASLALVYLLPFLLVIGLVAQETLPLPPRTVFCCSVMVALLTPAAWLPTWRGYPDPGGAFLIALAVWAYLHDPDLKGWWQIPLIGASLATAVLFRRHFAYGVTAFLITVIIMVWGSFLNDFWHRRIGIFHTLIQRNLYIGLIIAVSLSVLLTLGRPFVIHVLAQKSSLLYGSWQATPLNLFQYFRSYYGWLGLSLAGIGLIASALVFEEKRQNIAFLALFGGVSSAQWLFLVRELNPQYTLHFTTIILLGLAALVCIVLNQFRGLWRAVATLALGIYFGANAAFGLAPQVFPQKSALQLLLANNSSPLQRPDYAEVIQLVKSLHARATQQEPISVFASSSVLNYDLLVGVDKTLYPSHPLNLLFTPEIDTRDPYPIEPLLRAEYVVLGKPLQIHLAPSEHEVLSTVYEAFTENWEISRDFIRLSETFSLTEGVQAEIYKRIKKTELGVAIRTFARIQEGVKQGPTNQPDWIQLSNLTSSLVSGSQRKYRLQAKIARQTDNPTAFLYLGNMPAEGKISGNSLVNGLSCAKIHLSLAAASGDGSILPLNEITIHYRESTPFAITFRPQGARYLLLIISSAGSTESTCDVVLDSVEVSNIQ